MNNSVLWEIQTKLLLYHGDYGLEAEGNTCKRFSEDRGQTMVSWTRAEAVRVGVEKQSDFVGGNNEMDYELSGESDRRTVCQIICFYIIILTL